MGVQRFVTPAGERMVILAEDDYLALADAAETASDVVAVERFKDRLAAGHEELLPAAMVEALLGGANPVRVWREHRGLSARDLAAKAGLAPAYLSQIETGRRDGTLATLRAIAGALDITLDDLVG